MKTKHSIFLLAVGALLGAATVQSQTTVLSDNYNVTTAGAGFGLGFGVNTLINPPSTRMTGTAAANLRYMEVAASPRSTNKYDISGSRLRCVTDSANIGRFTISANGATPYDFGPAVGATYATSANPAVYDIKISMRNDATSTARFSFGLTTVEGDANTWDFGIQMSRTNTNPGNYYSIWKRFDSASSGMGDLNLLMFNMQPGTVVSNGNGTVQSFVIRVTDAGAETSTYSSRIQVATNTTEPYNFIYDTASDTTLTNGFRFDSPARILDFDQAANGSGNVWYDSLSITSISSPAPPTPVTWTGQSSIDSNWSSVENWGGTAPQAGQPLVFDGVNRQTNIDDLISFDTPYVTFNNDGFSLTGNAFSISSTISNIAGASTIGTDLSFTTTGPKNWIIASGSVLTLSNTTTIETNGDHSLSGGGTLYSLGPVNIGLAAGSTANPPFTVLEGAHIIDGSAFTTRGGYRIGSTIGAGAQTILTNNATLAITATSGNLRVGDAANANVARLDIDNSTVTLSGSVVFGIGYNAGSKAVVTQNGGTVTAPLTSFSENAAAAGSYSITNGTLSTRVIRKNTAGGTASIFFDNATLSTASGASNALFFTGLNVAQIQAGGLVVDAQSDVTIGQALTGTGGLTKSNSASLTLTGANTFSGPVTVLAGVLSVGAANALPTTSTVNLNGGTLDLANNATVTGLQYAGVFKAAGTYGAIGSGATHENAQFTGTGLLTVTGGGTTVTTVTSTSSSTTVGQAVGFTITVTGTGDGTIPDGTVDLYDNGTPIATGLTLTPTTGTSAEATYATSSLALGAHPMTATWGGNSSYGPSTSAVYTQAVVQPPVLVSPVTASTVVADAGTNLTLTIVLQDSTGVSYQWSKGGVSLTDGSRNNAATVVGSTAATLTLAGVNAADASPGDYTCAASNGAGMVTSAAITLVVNDPAISVQPASTAFECGTNGCLSVAAAGTTNADGLLFYQWYTPNASGTAITDATNSTLCFNNIHAGSAGSYLVVVSNVFGNSVTSQVAVVTVQDTIKPVLAGVPADTTIECSTPLPDAPVVTATDSCDSNPTVTLNTVTNAGACSQSYAVVRTWTATDATGNTSTGTQTITVHDTTAPVITLVGGSVNSECHSAFVDPGYSANDACSGSTSVSVSGSLNVNAVGTYTVTYSATDSCGNGATATRVVNVVDTTGPTLVGVPGNTTAECGSIPSAATVTATDACDAGPTVSMNESTAAGSCAQASVITRTWTATDAAGNTSTASQTITVSDTTAPVVTLSGNASETIECKASFTDAGATANDECAGSLTVSTSGTVITNVTGDYTLTYSATDPCGNVGTATRVVHVVDSTAPTITLNEGPSTICRDASYSDPGATAIDDCGGSYSVVPSGAVNTSAAGSYTITYTATDSANNSGTATRVVQVVNCADPDIVVQPNTTNYGVATGSITLNVQVAGTAPFKYQWYQWKVGQPAAKAMKPSSTFVGSTTASLTLNHLAASFNGTYYCVITNGLGASSVTTNAVVTVLDTPKILITAKPTKRPLAGSDVALTAKVIKGDVTVDGITPKYQWYFGGVLMPGQTGKVLSLSQVQTNTQWGNYTFYVTNAATVGSATLLLDVQDDVKTPTTVMIKTPRDKSKMTNGLPGLSQTNVAPSVEVSGIALDRGLITNVTLFRTNPVIDSVEARFVTPDLVLDTNAVAGKRLTWLASLNLVDGTNIFYVVATDSRGNVKASKPVSYYYMGNPAALTIQTAPVAHPLIGTKDLYYGKPADGAILDIGHLYTIKASGVPSTFVHWEDVTDPLNPAVLSTSVSLTFPMKTNMVLKATWTR